MRKPRSASAVVLVGSLVGSAALLGLVGPTAEASCVGPAIGVGSTRPAVTSRDRVAVRLNEPLTVTGNYFHHGCADVVVGSGCGTHALEKETPMTDVPLRLRQGNRTWLLGRADAEAGQPTFPISWQIRLPDQVRAGPASLTAGGTTLKVRIVR